MKRRWIGLSVGMLLIVLLGGYSSVSAEQMECGKIYLNVSRIDFSIVGESENIYEGTAPVDQIQWKSEDPTVVSVENGVLMANGVGKTIVSADYHGQHWQCEAGCLANSLEDLAALPDSIVLAPKRIPCKTYYDPIPIFKNSALVGDSITNMWKNHERETNQLGHPLFLAKVGVSLTEFNTGNRLLSLRGKSLSLWDAIEESGVDRIFMMLGQNDVTRVENVAVICQTYQEVVGKIREKNPNVVIYLETITPEFHHRWQSNARNEKINEFNRWLREYAAEEGTPLIDVAKYYENHLGYMANEYAWGDIHINNPGCDMWGEIIAAYLELKEIRSEVL